MTPEYIKKHFPNASRAFIEANCRVPVELESPERKPDPVQALVRREKVQRGRKGRVVAVVTILACRRRATDDDNITAGAKALRDAIATSLGVDDGDRRIRWECRAVQTEGQEHTLVKISLL